MTINRKSIAYSFPTSINAKNLGYGKEGCWHIQITLIDIEGTRHCRTFIPHNAEGFESPDDPDLIAMFHETEGEPCPMFLKYGNQRAILATKRAINNSPRRYHKGRGQ